MLNEMLLLLLFLLVNCMTGTTLYIPLVNAAVVAFECMHHNNVNLVIA